MPSRRNPTRRNRNIGTAKQGHGQRNKLVIPDNHQDKIYWENLTDYRVVTRVINLHTLHIIVERTRDDACHACTVDDITSFLWHVSPADLAEVGLILLRQPTRKQTTLKSVWGRAVFYAEIGAYTGPAVILEAMTPDQPFRWSKSLTPDEQRELARLREDGHSIAETCHNYIITPSLESIRATQLYRTLPHEIGHQVDFAKTAIASDDDDGSDWDRKPSADKEAFAHRYADTLRNELKRQGIIPFPRQLNLERITLAGLNIRDFQPK